MVFFVAMCMEITHNTGARCNNSSRDLLHGMQSISVKSEVVSSHTDLCCVRRPAMRPNDAARAGCAGATLATLWVVAMRAETVVAAMLPALILVCRYENANVISCFCNSFVSVLGGVCVQDDVTRSGEGGCSIYIYTRHTLTGIGACVVGSPLVLMRLIFRASSSISGESSFSMSLIMARYSVCCWTVRVSCVCMLKCSICFYMCTQSEYISRRAPPPNSMRTYLAQGTCRATAPDKCILSGSPLDGQRVPQSSAYSSGVCCCCSPHHPCSPVEKGHNRQPSVMHRQLAPLIAGTLIRKVLNACQCLDMASVDTGCKSFVHADACDDQQQWHHKPQRKVYQSMRPSRLAQCTIYVLPGVSKS